MLREFLSDGGFLMWPLLAVLAATVFLAAFGISRTAGELLRMRRFRRDHYLPGRSTLAELDLAATRTDTLSSSFLRASIDRAHTDRLSGEDRRSAVLRVAAELRDEFVAELAWPADLLAFLSGYAAKLGLTGTVLGLCMHFLAFGTDGTSEIASKAMGIALYTTLGALGIAVIAEPCVYLLRWSERWIGDEFAVWETALGDALRAGEGTGECEGMSAETRARETSPALVKTKGAYGKARGMRCERHEESSSGEGVSESAQEGAGR